MFLHETGAGAACFVEVLEGNNGLRGVYLLPKLLDEQVATCAFLYSVPCSPSLPRNTQIILLSRLKVLSSRKLDEKVAKIAPSAMFFPDVLVSRIS